MSHFKAYCRALLLASLIVLGCTLVVFQPAEASGNPLQEVAQTGTPAPEQVSGEASLGISSVLTTPTVTAAPTIIESPTFTPTPTSVDPTIAPTVFIPTLAPAGKIAYLPLLFRNIIATEIAPIPGIPPATAVPPATPFAPAPAGTQLTITKKTVDGHETVLIDGPGVTTDIPGLAAAANSLVLQNGPLLVNEGAGVWRLTASLRVGKNVTLRINSPTVTWLKLRSNAGAETSITKAGYIFLDTLDGAIRIENTKVTSWDVAVNNIDATYKNGRAYLRAEGAARMDILASEIAYLGNPDGGGSYGMSWRDDEENTSGGGFLARVTGDVIGSDIHHLYYGYFSFAARGSLIKGNKFHDNVSYGFDPHDFTHGFIVEDNESFNNGNHGFIISRGCHDFIFRRNKSYNNTYKVDSKTFRAHGFMLDPGGLTSTGGEYTPSYNNLIEYNEAYNNQGFGIRVLDANTNTIRFNVFRNNRDGITLERSSYYNTVQGNTLINNAITGISFLGDPSLGDPHHNLVADNVISGNARDGIYIDDKSHSNEIRQNTISGNATGLRAIAETRLNFWLKNNIFGNPGGGIATTSGVNGGIAPPTALAIAGPTLSGKALPGALIDVFSDDGGQGQHYEGRAIADAAGNWSFTNPGPWRGSRITATQTELSKGSSLFASTVGRP